METGEEKQLKRKVLVEMRTRYTKGIRGSVCWLYSICIGNRHRQRLDRIVKALNRVYVSSYSCTKNMELIFYLFSHFFSRLFLSFIFHTFFRFRLPNAYRQSLNSLKLQSKFFLLYSLYKYIDVPLLQFLLLYSYKVVYVGRQTRS